MAPPPGGWFLRRGVSRESAPAHRPPGLPRGYRDAASEEREVTITRYVACPACARNGCVVCSFAGWTIGDSTAKIVVPNGATPGTRSGEPRLDGRICTSTCVTDLDCPVSMHCTTNGDTIKTQFVADAPAGLACVPDDY